MESQTDLQTGFDFRGLFILDLANNHQGDVAHARRIIGEMGRIAASNEVPAALKFQFRELDSFVHPAHRVGSANKHIPRFLDTRLSWEEYAELTDAVRESGMATMATPFDETSVDRLLELGIEVLKIASCSATDWPLLEKISECNKPVIFSTGGLSMKEMDDLVSFFDHRRVRHAIMHCVAMYPTPDDQLNLNQIDLLRDRYRDKTIGFSTHENPDDTVPVTIAVAKGAQILERHVGLVTDAVSLNAYSSTPEQVDRWMKAAAKARAICGESVRLEPIAAERESLNSLKRGVYLSRPVKAGATLARSDVYFAMPLEAGQLNSGEWKEGIRAMAALEKDQALTAGSFEVPPTPEKQVLFTAIHTIKGMLNEARIALSTDFHLEFSHHHGIAKFREVGCTLIDCINREYCKKLIVMLPGQSHPSHYHKRKEETFQVLSGLLEIEIEGRWRTLLPGDIQVVPQGVWHSFRSDRGAIFEEVSTTHFNDDSFYEDKDINRLPREVRKTVVKHWGRYQI